MRYFKVFVIFVIFGIGIGIGTNKGMTATKPKLEDDGNIVFATTDTIATTGITWSEVGFTIRRDESDGSPMKDKKYAILLLKDSYRTKKDNGNGKYTVTFRIPKEDVNAAMTKAGISAIEDEDIIYLNGIFKVTRNGVADKNYYYTLNGIRGAADWRNKNDFKELFDLKMPFESTKYPVTIEYYTSQNQLIATKSLGEYKEGEKVSVTLDTSKRFDGNSYEIYRSYLVHLKNEGKKVEDYRTANGNTLTEITNRQFKAGMGGTKIIALMKKESDPKTIEEDVGSIGDELPDKVESFGVMNGDDRGNEAYEATDGIPVMENLYANGFCEDYIREYEFKKKEGVKTYPVVVRRTYILTWTETSSVWNQKTKKMETTYRNQSYSTTVMQTISIKRNYAYWQIERLGLYLPKQMMIQNGALPGGLIYLEGREPRKPVVLYQQWGAEENHIKDPVYPKTITLSSVTISGGSSMPSVPSEDFSSYAEHQVSEIMVRNDSLSWEGKEIMNGEYTTKQGKKPKEIPGSSQLIGENVFYEKGIAIEKTRMNGTYSSSGKVVYEAMLRLGKGTEKQVSYVVEDINPVTVHTPVVCNGMVEDKYRDCQMLFPDTNRCSLVLGLEFKVRMETEGQHRLIKGYGYNDYQKYMSLRQVKFPFDVVKNGVRKPADQWMDAEVEETYFLPCDVMEGQYEIEFRTVAVNNAGSLENGQPYANEDLDYYVAVNQVPVEVSGRLYQLKVFDISDYPLWKRVFRKENSLEKSGFSFSVLDFPIRKGKHPLYPAEGSLKPGYMLRMSLITSGNMEGEKCCLRVIPRFYHINKVYDNPVEVEVYYGETIENRYYPFVEMGSLVDEKNRKLLKLSDINLAIAQEELDFTAKKKSLTVEELKILTFQAYQYNQILIPSMAQILQETQGMQKWYFEYSLPSKIYVVEKGVDVKDYCQKNTLTFREDFWKKEGYLVVNFDIETIKDGKRHLSYINETMSQIGYCNMWKKEGFLYEYVFRDGDMGLFELKKSAALDYQSRGTH